MDNKIDEYRNIIIESFGGSVAVYGMNETIGRIYGLLYFEDEPMSLEEIADHLLVSKATISNNIRLLYDLKMVQKVWQRGSRKDFYIAERDFEKIIQEVLKNKELKQVYLLEESLARAKEGYQSILDSDQDQELIATAKNDLDKIETLVHWMIKYEAWINFILEANIKEGPKEELKEIEVDWDD